ncbi:uncharacterized protein LOC114927945 [Nylanderia fulva]|uniref:uncharacterized protein LOC114927945 n=1 Tax=Nylanderia fulva TaxID=613905 RepID=UPI0010FB766B|nr:uncharacterized protein LOC114927945 [Nylanderia fulva]
MSNIFNLLGGIADDKDQLMKPIMQSDVSHEVRLNSLKAVGGTKPKGLSMRSNSAMNVSNGTPIKIKKNTCDKDPDCRKLKVTQLDINGRPISPSREKTKKLMPHLSKFNESLKEPLKEKTLINKNKKAQLNEDVFKKPFPPKKYSKKYPKPETLAYWCDDQYNFDYGYIEAIEKEFKDLLSKEKENIKPSEDRNIISEPLVMSEVPELVFDRSLDDCKKSWSCDLPEVSDISDDDCM